MVGYVGHELGILLGFNWNYACSSGIKLDQLYCCRFNGLI